MGRPGAGGGGSMGGGSHSMGGGHVGGSHSMGGGGSFGGGRPGVGSGGSFGGGHSGGGFGGGGHMGGGNPGGHMGGGGPHPGGGFGGGPHGPVGGPGPMGPGPRRHRGGCVAPIVIFIIVIAIGLVLFSGGCTACACAPGSSTYTTTSSNASVTQTSSHEREKLDSGNSFMNDCVVDELGWFDNISTVESGLEDFWEDTGVQPYVYLKAYDASISEDDEQEWAENFYTENFDREDIFLYIYFAAEDSDNDFGTSVYINGRQVTAVMDSEAVEIFWNYLDENWFDSSQSMDDVILNTFNSTAKTIMKTDVKKSRADALKWFFIVLAIIVVVVFIIVLIVITNKRKHQKAEEDAKILNTPIDEIDGSDDLVKKYTDDK